MQSDCADQAYCIASEHHPEHNILTQKAIVTTSETKNRENKRITYYQRLPALMLLVCGTGMSRHVCKRRLKQFEGRREHTAGRVSRRGEVKGRRETRMYVLEILHGADTKGH